LKHKNHFLLILLFAKLSDHTFLKSSVCSFVLGVQITCG